MNYARSLLAATPENQLVSPKKPKAMKGISHRQFELMKRESGNLERELRLVEGSYGTDHLDLVLARGYVSKLISNSRIKRYLTMNHPEFLLEFEKIQEKEAPATSRKDQAPEPSVDLGPTV